MMDVRRVTQTHRDHGVIVAIGNDDDGWWRTKNEAVREIEQHRCAYYVGSGRLTTPVHVVHGPHGPYLRTVPDGMWMNNLGELPEPDFLPEPPPVW